MDDQYTTMPTMHMDTHTFPTNEQVKLTEELHVKIEREKAALEAPWLGILPFCIDAYGDNQYRRHANILEYMKNTAMKGFTMRFLPLVYDPSNPKESIGKLVHDICEVSRQHGVELICGRGVRSPICKSLVCSCSLIYQDRKKQEKENNEISAYRSESLHNDRKNNRPKGYQNLPRRNTTKRRLTSVDPMCTFRINLYHDSNSFYLKVGSGCAFHCYHVALDCDSLRLPTRYITKNDADLLQDGRQASISSNSARNLFFVRSGGILLSKTQIATITGTGKTSQTTSGDIKEDLQNYFQNEKAEVCFLYQKSAVNQINGNKTGNGVAEYHSTDHLKPIVEPAVPIHTEEADEMLQFASMNRQAQGIDDTQDVFMGVAWVLPQEKQTFQLFPYVVHFDCVEDTNNEKRSLFTATGRDSTGTMFTFLRAFLPSQCAWVFRWLFQNVLPRMFGNTILSKIVVMITDGDAQETSQLDLAIKLVFPQVFRVRCVWHVVDRGMTNYFPKSPVRKNIDSVAYNKWEKVRLTIRKWLFSWSDDRCETKEEFLLSKALFLNYLKSNEVKEALGSNGCDQLQDFYGKRIEPHEDFFVFHRRLQLFHLDTNSNSAHEGTNNGMKYHSVRVLPTHGLVESTRILTHQSNLKCGDSRIRHAANEARKSLWSDLPTADHITRLGESLLLTQWNASTAFVSCGPHNNMWLVMCNTRNEMETAQEHESFPRFRRVRTVTRDSYTGVLHCSCCYFQRIGIACRHHMK